MANNNILLVGLQYDSNLGDRAIFMCAKRMLADILSDLGLFDYEIREMDMTGRAEIGQNPVYKQARLPFTRKVVRKLGHVFHIFGTDAWAVSYRCRKAAVIQCDKFCDAHTKAIIFAGGGIIKYKYLNFHDYLVAIIGYAQKHHIPVMLSAAGVEGYDERNACCRRLKKALNSECVRAISTRDDIHTLTQLYCRKHSDIKTALAADPACSISRYYPIRVSEHERIIGLGVVRETLFTENGIYFDKSKMLRFWAELYHEINRNGYGCKLFCNGTKADYLFAEDLLAYMGIENKDGNVLAERPTSIEELTQTITGCSGIIAGRLHASVIAYSYGIPSVGLVWNEKQIMFGKAIGCENRFFRVDEFDPSKIVKVLLSSMDEGYDENARKEYCATTGTEIRRFLNDVLI